MVDQATTGKSKLKPLLDLWYPDGKPEEFPIPKNNKLIRNIYWGESLLLLPGSFQASTVLVLEGGSPVHGWPWKLIFPRLPYQ